MPTGLWGGGSAGKSSGTRRLFRQDATKLDGTSGSRLDSTREILVDERRGEERSRCCPFRRLGFISRLLLENTRETEGGEGGVIERERKRMENSGEKSGREGREEKETNYARVVVFRGCIVGREGSNFRSLSGQPRDRLFLHPFSLTLTRHFPFCREESFVSHRPPVKDSTK